MRFVVLMGVSGSGKSSMGRLLAEKTGGVFLDTDDFHPEANKEKMAAGIPLADEDRWGWLDRINGELRSRAGITGITFLACSALRKAYRAKMTEGVDHILYVHLRGSREEIRRRLEKRRGHFMSPSLLESQFATLEHPEDALNVSIEQPPDAIAAEILRGIGWESAAQDS
jgi:gluconokinase